MYKYKIEVKKISGALTEGCCEKNIPKRLVLKSKKPLSKERLMSETANYFEKQYGVIIESIWVTNQTGVLANMITKMTRLFENELGPKGILHDYLKDWMNNNSFERQPEMEEAIQMYTNLVMKRFEDSLNMNDFDSAASVINDKCLGILNRQNLTNDSKVVKIFEKIQNPFKQDEYYFSEPISTALDLMGFDSVEDIAPLNISVGQKLVLAYHLYGQNDKLHEHDIAKLLF